MGTTNHSPATNGHAHRATHNTIDLCGHFHATTLAFLAAQQSQNEVLVRFLQTQERIFLSCHSGELPDVNGHVPRVESAVPIERVEDVSERLEPSTTQPVPRPRPAPATARPPVAVPLTVPTPTAATPVPTERRTTSPRAVTATNGKPSALAPSTSGEPPATEQFRRDLLEVVSRRTGYPVDALNENLALEAGLGIDSIKTVEVFSNLKTYHPYFRADGQDEEELLAEFSKFKTLRDIVQFYDRRRLSHVAIQRHGVAAVPAPAQAANDAGAKKKSLTATSSLS